MEKDVRSLIRQFEEMEPSEAIETKEEKNPQSLRPEKIEEVSDQEVDIPFSSFKTGIESEKNKSLETVTITPERAHTARTVRGASPDKADKVSTVRKTAEQIKSAKGELGAYGIESLEEHKAAQSETQLAPEKKSLRKRANSLKRLADKIFKSATNTPSKTSPEHEKETKMVTNPMFKKRKSGRGI